MKDITDILAHSVSAALSNTYGAIANDVRDKCSYRDDPYEPQDQLEYIREVSVAFALFETIKNAELDERLIDEHREKIKDMVLGCQKLLDDARVSVKGLLADIPREFFPE